MSQKTDAALSTQAQVIKNETQVSGNTKTRVYQMFQDLIDSKVNLEDAGEGGAEHFKGDYDASVDSLPDETGLIAGDFYRFSVGGDIDGEPFPANTLAYYFAPGVWRLI